MSHCEIIPEYFGKFSSNRLQVTPQKRYTKFSFQLWQKGHINGLLSKRHNSIANTYNSENWVLMMPSLSSRVAGATSYSKVGIIKTLAFPYRLCLSHEPIYMPFLLTRSHDIDGLVQERRHSSALAVELRLSCSNPSIWTLNSLRMFNDVVWLDWALFKVYVSQPICAQVLISQGLLSMWYIIISLMGRDLASLIWESTWKTDPAEENRKAMQQFFIACCMGLNSNYSGVPLKRSRFSHKYSQKTPYSSPVRARYGVSFVNSDILPQFRNHLCNILLYWTVL